MLEALEGEDSEYSGFCTKIREFAAKQDDDGMVQFMGFREQRNVKPG